MGGIVLIGLFVLLEVGLRSLLGFGNPLLYLADEEIGYLLAPNQRTRRFGNRIVINEYSMRSPTMTKTRPASTLRILLLGDSIANGGWWTDQKQTISARVTTQLEFVVREVSEGRGWAKREEMLQRSYGNSPTNLSPHLPIPSSPTLAFEHIEVLNASANSWGPQNELAYLKRFGTFGAQAVVLLLNTDDLFAATPTSEPVGRDRNYPSRKPLCALVEAFDRYLSPKLPQFRIKAIAKRIGIGGDGAIGGICANKVAPWEPVPSAQQQKTAGFKDDPLDLNLEAISRIQTLATGTGAEFVLAMTPLLREIGEPGPRDYEIKARHRLTKLTQDQQIHYLDFLPAFNCFETPQSLYRDHIHLSPLGNQRVSEAIARSLQNLLQ